MPSVISILLLPCCIENYTPGNGWSIEPSSTDSATEIASDIEETDSKATDVSTDSDTDTKTEEDTETDFCPEDPDKLDPGECGCGTPEEVCADLPYIKTARTPFYANENIIIHYANLPSGDNQSWIGIFEEQASDQDYLQQISTAGLESGTLQFNGLAPGSYEGRLFLGGGQTPAYQTAILVVPRSNTKALRFQGTGDGTAAKQTVDIETHTYYQLSVDLHVADGSVGSLIFDTNERFDDTCRKSLQTTLKWTRFECTFQSGTFQDITVRLSVSQTPEFEGKAYFDNVVLKEQGSETNLIDNGGFEEGTTAWTLEGEKFTLSAETLPPEN